MILLKQLLQDYNLVQAELSRAANVSPATISQLLNHGIWPKKLDKKEEIKQKISDYLTTKGISFSENIFNGVARNGNSQLPNEHPPLENVEDSIMVLRKQSLTQAAKKTFSLFRSPFSAPESPEDLYLSSDARIVREALYSAIKYPSFLAIVGESGSGKSTLRKDLKARVCSEGDHVIFIEPYILAMEDNDIKGKTLKSAQIVDAIMAEIAPGVHQPRSVEARFRQLHKYARETVKAGNKLMVIIEEAHCLPLPTLKHLKRFFELESDNGFSKLFSIVLIGHPDLLDKLSVNNQDVKEVVQRCDIIPLMPLDDHLKPYLSHIFERVGKKLADVMNDDAVEALRDKLTYSRGRDRVISNLFPLLVNNTLISAMNLAADICESTITADIIRKA